MPAKSRKQLTDELVLVCHRLADAGLVAATDGNVSARLSNGNILTTRSVLHKADATPAEIIETDASGKIVKGKGKPSSELKMHLFIYRNRPDVHAVVHAHPPHATGMAVAGKSIPADILPEVAVMTNGIPLAPYATPSTNALAESLAPFVATHPVVFLQNHGVVAYAESLERAFWLMEKAEHAANILTVAAIHGGARKLPKGEVSRLLTIYNH